MEYTVPAPCPHCGVEVAMEMELTDDGLPPDALTISQSWYQAVGIAPDEEQEYDQHACHLTDAEIEAMCEVASKRAQTDPYYRDARWEDIDW